MNHWAWLALALWLAVIAWLSVLTQRALARLQQAHETRHLSTQLAQELRFSSDELTRLARLYAVTGKENYEKQFWRVLDARNGRIPRRDGRLVSLQTLMQQAGFTETEFSLLKQAEDLSNVLVRTEAVAMNAVKGLFDDGNGQFSRRGQPDLALASRLMHDDGYQNAKAAILDKVDEFEYEIHQRTLAGIASRTREYERLAQITLLAVPAMFVLAALSFFLMKRQFSRPLLPVVTALRTAASELSGTADRITTASDTASEGARTQAASLMSTSTALQSLADASAQNSSLARQAKGSAEAARENAKSGVAAMQGMATELADLQRIGKDLDRSMQDIDSASSEVQKIIKSIDEIAFQTNILALNAAVEAARAGDAGRGFAVVAEEVRNLSKRSTAAAKETSTLLRETSLKSTQGLRTTEQVSKSLHKLALTTQGVDASLQDITREVFGVDDLMNQVVGSSEQQSRSIDSIRVAVAQVDEVIQASLSRVEEDARAAHSLATQARRLNDAVDQIEGLISSDAAAPRSAPVAVA
jgi:methyl-accepting chemotaxis protein